MKALKDIAAARRQSQQEAAPVPVPVPAPVRTPSPRMVEETSTVAARVPDAKALAFKERVLQARRFLPNVSNVNHQLAMEALIDLVEEEDIFQRWLSRMEALRER